MALLYASNVADSAEFALPLLRDPASRWDHFAITTYDFDEFSVRSQRYRYIRYIDGSEELYDHRSDPEEWRNLADDPRFAEIKRRHIAAIPESPAPLVKTSEKLKSHHIPPFRSRSEYEDWMKHGKDNQYLLDKHWR